MQGIGDRGGGRLDGGSPKRKFEGGKLHGGIFIVRIIICIMGQYNTRYIYIDSCLQLLQSFKCECCMRRNVCDADLKTENATCRD